MLSLGLVYVYVYKICDKFGACRSVSWLWLESKSSPPLATKPFVIESDEMLLVLGSLPYQYSGTRALFQS